MKIDVKYYRNTVTIQDIEPGALWQLNGEMLQLVDDDQYVAVSLAENETNFIEESEVKP